MNNSWARYALIAAMAAVLGCLFTVELYLGYRADGLPADFVDIAISQFGRAAMWAVLAPFIFRMQEKVPVRSPGLARALAFHCAMSVVIMLTFFFGRHLGYHVFFPKHGEGGSLWWTVTHGFHGHNLVDLACYAAVLGVGYGLELHQRFKHEELKSAQLETRLVETELKALRQQLHPHFLFNTMNTIAVLVRERRHDDAIRLISRLSALLRMSLDNTGVPEVTVQQELEFLGHYVEIQQARFSDRLKVSIDVSPDARRGRIPNLLLQPLVENAILHGVAPKSGPGTVAICGCVNGERLELSVTDDGVGLPDMPGRPREGVGLANTRERLAKIYGSHSQLVLRSEPGRGVSVRIVLPFRP